MTQILDRDDQPGIVENDDGENVIVRLSTGAALHFPSALVAQREDGVYRADFSFDAADSARHTLDEVEEHVRVGTRTVETGRVIAQTFTDSVEEAVDTTGWRESVTVERVPIGRVVESVETVRTEDDTTIIPVYEEVLVVRKQVVLREEVRITKHREPVPGSEHIALRRQRVEVNRLPPEA
ncbi:MAG: hypothetical protein Rubg2KO_08700 [Rubricoccaceae bacterium]